MIRYKKTKKCKLMNILHLEASKGFGGQERRIVSESIGMIKRNHKVVIAASFNAKIINEAKKNNILTYEVNFNKKSWFISFFRLIKIIKKNNINIINTHSSLDSWLGGIVAKFLKIQVIRTRHVTISIKKGINSKILYGFLADYVITTSKEIVSIIAKQANKNINLIKSIPTGLDLENINCTKDEEKSFKKKYNFEKNDFLIGTLCIIRNWKGIDDLLNAAKLLKNYENIKVLVIGDGYKDKFIERKEKEKINNVIFIGHLENPYPAIRALDVFTLLSTANEGISQASLQAAYFKKPLITTPTGGLKEICLENVTGFQVPIFSKEKIKEAILKLYNNRELINVLGTNAKELALKHSKENMLDKIEEIYNFLKNI
ncbi:MAG: putative glycosyltransferase EpsD [Candidatus Anoxychlamydiales bacterium]|nr:putative glycosyltransferase EpsD [Candidatus Anoxychlamydiales bacterium]